MTARAETTARYLEILELVSMESRRDLALGLCVRTLEALAHNSPSPTQAALAGGIADAVRALVPAEMLAALNSTKKD